MSAQDPATRARALVDRLTLVPAPSRAAEIARLAKSTDPRIVAFVNAHAINLVWSRADVAAAFAGADVLLRDGKGMALLLERMGRDPGANMNGTDLIPELLDAVAPAPLAVFGTAEPWLERGVTALTERGSKVVCAHHGFEPTAHYAELCAIHRPEVVLLAMGMPKQETVALALRALPNPPRLIICGGAIVDFLAGRHARAPAWMQARGLEWLWRLGREPRRLFSRYVIGNAQFLARLRAIARL